MHHVGPQQPQLALDVQRRLHVPVLDRLGEARREALDLRDDAVGLAVLDVVPVLAVAQLVRVPLRPEADVVPARRCDRRVDRAEGHREHGWLPGRDAAGEVAIGSAQLVAVAGEQLEPLVGAAVAWGGRVARQVGGAEADDHADAVADPDALEGVVEQGVVAEQPHGRQHVAPGEDPLGLDAVAAPGVDAGDAGAVVADRGCCVVEAQGAPVRDEPLGEGFGQHADPPTGRPGGSWCMTMFQPTRSAVATSCVGGPAWAPSHDSAVLSRSSLNVASRALPTTQRRCQQVADVRGEHHDRDDRQLVAVVPVDERVAGSPAAR